MTALDPRPILHHIPACPFSQRLEIVVALKGREDAVRFHTVDITVPRDPRLLELSGGTTALPILELPGGEVPGGGALKESLVLLRYFDEVLDGPSVRRTDPMEHAVESLMVTQEGPFTGAGYRLVMNQDRARRDGLVEAYLDAHRSLDRFLVRHATGDGPYLFDRFGWAETVFTPMFWRFEFVRHYEEVDLPATAEFARVRAWRDACMAHPAAQQMTAAEVVTLYYDYAHGAGNGALLPGRTRSSFVLDPPWHARPLPPRGKAGAPATDAELGLVSAP